MRQIAIALALLGTLFSPASAQAPVVPSYSTSGNPPFSPVTPAFPLPVTGGAPYAYTNLTPSQNGLTVASSTALTVPAGATYAVVCVEAQNVRWTWDGTTTPTSTVGNLILAGQCTSFSGASILAALRFIQTASSATLDVEYAK
jgi:hypothetical protein